MSTIDQLITEITIPVYSPSISYKDPVMLLGSCFAEHMESKLKRYKYNVLGNPFGIIYNSSSMADSLIRISKKKYYDVSELIMQDGLYHSMDHHGSYSGTNAAKVLDMINTSIDDAHTFLEKAKFIFISLGTSKVYRYKNTGKIAANNHKIPLTQFDPATLSVTDIEKDLLTISDTIRSLNTESHIIWTVSPIRHLRDGFVENQRSKAALIVAIANYISTHPGTNYFPAYEIMMDQLRDYRFYARDMIHPSEIAIDIIWEMFVKTYINTQDALIHSTIERTLRAREHRFLHDNKEAIKSFAQSQLRNIDQLAHLYPDMDWKEERQYFFHLTEPD